MTDDWFEFLEALLQEGARFLVVGAHALAVQGVPRGTQDLDVWRIDLLTTVTGVEDFASAWHDRVEHPVRGLAVPFIGRRALVANKRATGRLKDLADLEALGE